MASRTRRRVRSLTAGDPLRTRETVPTPTPASAATSAMVAPRISLLLNASWKRFHHTTGVKPPCSFPPLPVANHTASRDRVLHRLHPRSPSRPDVAGNRHLQGVQMRRDHASAARSGRDIAVCANPHNRCAPALRHHRGRCPMSRGGSGAPSTRSTRARSRTRTATASGTCAGIAAHARPPRRPRRGGDLAVAVLPLADGRLRLRRLRLLRRRPGVRDARRLRRAGRSVPRARHARGDRLGAEPHVGPAPVVRRVALEPRQPAARLVRLARRRSRTAGRRTTGRRSSRPSGRRGRSTRRPGSGTCTRSWPSSRTSTGTTRRSRRRCTT